MMAFLDALRHGVCGLNLAGKRVLVAVSGGADSVALLRGLKALSPETSLDIAAAHLDHMLRGEDSAADAIWVQELCDRLSVPCFVEREDIPTRKSAGGQTWEEAARTARYEFLECIAHRQNCSEIALAHTANDQAETILHHILRGTGISGLRGIPRERELSGGLRLVRPLLDIRRDEIEAWLKESGQDYRIDASNLDPAFTRNRIRHELLPMLQSSFNPQVVPALLRLGRQASDMEDVIDAFAQSELEAAIVERSALHVKMRCESLAKSPLAFRRSCLTALWRMQNWPRKRMTFAHWNDLAELLAQNRGAITLPGNLTATRHDDGLTVAWKQE